MNKVLELAQNFEEQSKQQAASTERALQSVFERHELFISEALKSSEKRLDSAIQERNRRIRRLALRGWLWMGLSLFLVLVLGMGSLYWTGLKIADNLDQIATQSRTLEQLNQSTWGIVLQESSEGRFILLPAHLKVQTGWDAGKYQAIRINQE